MLDTAMVKRLRETLGLSQREAARLAGMGTAQAWSKVELGDGESVTLRTVAKVATALQRRPKDLLK